MNSRLEMYGNINNQNNIYNQRHSSQRVPCYKYNRCDQNIDHLRDAFNYNSIDPGMPSIYESQNIRSNNIDKIPPPSSSSTYSTQYQNFYGDNKNQQAQSVVSDNMNVNNYRSNYLFNPNSTNSSNFSNNIYNNSNQSFYRNNNINNSYQSLQSAPIHYNNNYNINNNMNNNFNNNFNNNINNLDKPYYKKDDKVNFNGINYNVGTNISQNNNRNNLHVNQQGNWNNMNNNINNNINQNNNINHINNSVFNSGFRNLKYNDGSAYNINLSSISSQDIYRSYELQKRESEKKKKEEYGDILKKQIEEKKRREELERQKEKEKELKEEEKFKNYYLQQEKQKNENNNNINNINSMNNQIKQYDKVIENNNNIQNFDMNKYDNDLDRNILETIQKNQYHLIPNKPCSINKFKRSNTIDRDTNSSKKISRKRASSNSIVKSGIDVIEGSKNSLIQNPIPFTHKNNSQYCERIDNNNNNLLNLIIPNNKTNKNETEEYLDSVIAKTDKLTETLQKTRGQKEEDRMEEMCKVLNQNQIINNRQQVHPSQNKERIPVPSRKKMNNEEKTKYNMEIEAIIQGVDVGAIKYRSKYENYEDENNNNNTEKKTQIKNKEIINQNKDQLNNCIKGTKQIDSEKIINKNIKNEDVSSDYINKHKKDKQYKVKEDILSRLNSKYNPKNETEEPDYSNKVKDSLNSDMKLTFGEGGTLNFGQNNPEINSKNSEKTNKNEESASTTKNNQSLNRFTFGENFDIKNEKNESKTTNKKNKKNKIKTVIKEENNEENDDYEEEEKYDIKVNSENDINYENMFNETKQSDLKFLDFDKFCDIPDGENPKRNKKKKKTKAKKNTDNNSIDEELCNVSYSDDEENKTKKNALESSKTIEKQLNFFSDSLCKGIGHKFNEKKDIIKNDSNDNENNEDDNINLVSRDKEKEENEDKEEDLINNSSKNKLEESGELRDSYCDDLIKNIDKYRNLSK